MNQEITGQDVAVALRKLADAIENGKAVNVRAVTQLEFADVVQETPIGPVQMGKIPTGNVVMVVNFLPVYTNPEV